MPEQEKTRPIYKNVSIEELNRLLDETPEIEEKLALAQYYILCYGIDGNPSCSPAQLINAAKEKILQATVDAKKTFYNEHGYNPAPASFKGVDPGKIEESEGPLFLKNPMLYMANMAKLMSFSEPPEDAPEQLIAIKNNGSFLADRIFNEKAYKEYEGLQAKNRADGLIFGVAKRQPCRDNASPEEILEPYKGGFWERWRKKTSQEFINFRETFKAVKDPESSLYGDIDALERDTKAYLVHKIPGYDPEKLPTQEQINSLSGTGKARAQLCLDVLKSVIEQRNLKISDEIYHDNPVENDLVELMPEELHLKYQKEMMAAAEEEKKFAQEVENDLDEEEAIEEEEEADKDKDVIEEKENEKEADDPIIE